MADPKLADPISTSFARMVICENTGGFVDEHSNEKALVEVDPSGRYIRSGQVWVRGKARIVYHGFDRLRGVEVAWNQLHLMEPPCEEDKERLEAQVAVLSKMDHQHIMKFHAAWIDEEMQVLNFITEYSHPGPLRRHRRSHKTLPRNLLKLWAWQILQGLAYLHMQQPPIIHKYLQCDNIFINATTGIVKVGDLGLAKILEGGLSRCQSSLGSPEFLAPELYHGDYSEKVDIYAYGMVLLEIATVEFPYRECENGAEIYSRASSGVLPASLSKVQDPETKLLINLCLNQSPEKRPSAKQLVEHPYFESVRPVGPKSTSMSMMVFQSLDESDTDQSCSSEAEWSAADSVSVRSAVSCLSDERDYSNSTDEEDGDEIPGMGTKNMGKQIGAPYSDNSDEEDYDQISGTGTNFMVDEVGTPYSDNVAEEDCDQMSEVEMIIMVQQAGVKGKCVDFTLTLTAPGQDMRFFEFNFNLELDSVESVAMELQEEFELTDSETETFMRLLRDELLIVSNARATSTKSRQEKGMIEVVIDSRSSDVGFTWPPVREQSRDPKKMNLEEENFKAASTPVYGAKQPNVNSGDDVVVCNDLDAIWVVSKNADQIPFIRTMSVKSIEGQILTVPEDAKLSRVKVGGQDGRAEEKVLMVHVDNDAPPLVGRSEPVIGRKETGFSEQGTAARQNGSGDDQALLPWLFQECCSLVNSLFTAVRGFWWQLREQSRRRSSTSIPMSMATR